MSERTGASLEAVVAEACRTYNGLRNPRHGPAVDPDAIAGLAMLIEATATRAGARIAGPDDLAAIGRARELLQAVREYDGYDDFGPHADWPNGNCRSCNTGFDDATGINAARARVYAVLGAMRDQGDDARLAAWIGDER